MTTLKKTIRTVLLTFSLSLFVGCSNLDVGFEEGSVFHSEIKDDIKLESTIVNVYLDKSVQSTDKFRLVINNEDTEMNLSYNIITRFGIDQRKTIIVLFKNNAKSGVIHLTLENKKNYFLRISENDSQIHFTQISQKLIRENVKATPIFISEEAAKKEEIQIVTKTKEEIKKEKVELHEKQNIGLDTKSPIVASTPKEIQKTQEKKHSGYKISKTLQEKYDAGEAIFYYDPNDGE